MKLRYLLAPLALGTALFAAPASAAHVSTCEASLGSFGPVAASECSGWYSGNVLSNSPDHVAVQTHALQDLGLTFTAFNDYLKIEELEGGTLIDFGTALFGETVIGIKFGGGSGVDNSTGFFLFNFTEPTSFITTTLQASSAAVLYQTGNGSAVPEPGTWAMMLMGFGAAGFAMRRRKSGLELLRQMA